MKWEEPPESGGFEKKKRNVYTKEAEELRSHPGVWGLVDIIPVDRDAHARTVANSIIHGKYAAFRPEGSFNAVSRKVPGDDGNLVIKVYGKYVKAEAADDETYR